METAVVTSLIAGGFSLTTALTTVWLKHYLEHRPPSPPSPPPPAPVPVPIASPSPAPVPATAPAPAPLAMSTPVTSSYALESPPKPRPTPPSSGASLLFRAGAIIAIGFAIGSASRMVRNLITGPVHYEAIASLGILVFLSLIRALRRSGLSARFWLYQLEVFSLWTAFASGWSLVNGGIWSDAMVTFTTGWLGCAAVGGLIVFLRGKPAA